MGLRWGTDLAPWCPKLSQKVHKNWSGGRESNPRRKLGKLLLCHSATPATLLLIRHPGAAFKPAEGCPVAEAVFSRFAVQAGAFTSQRSAAKPAPAPAFCRAASSTRTAGVGSAG